MIDFKKLVEAGVHFGHKKSRWNPKMEPYIWGFKNNIHLIDVSKTARQLEKAAKFLESVAAERKKILWIGTKKAAQEVVVQTAQELGYPCVTHRWIGGTLTNFSQVKKSITKLLHLEDVIKKSEQSHYTKKEIVSLQKMVDRLQKNVGNIRNISWPIGAIVIVDVKKEQTALREAAVMGIPVVALVDTNSDPADVDYVIPANDDAPKSIRLIIDYLAEAVKAGQQKATEKPTQERQETEEEEAARLLEESEEDEVVSAKDKDEKRSVKKMKTKEPIKPKKLSPRPRPSKEEE
ncbi:MAG: 30S ribosomal protein S2 [Candidatus Babeliales bacterium]